MLPSEYYLMSGTPIILNNNLGKIFQPKIIDFINMGTTIEEFAQIFCVRLDIIDVKDEDLEQLKSVLKDFDLFFLDEDSTSLNKLIECLKFLYRTEKIYLSKKRQCILINDEIILNRDNFTYLADVILNMLCMEKPKRRKKERKYADDYRQKIWEKMQRYRQEKEEKDRLSLLDIVNIVVHHGAYIDYDKVFNMTYYQLINSYTTLMGKTNYEEYTMFKTSGQFKMEHEVKHWGITNRIKKGIAL